MICYAVRINQFFLYILFYENNVSIKCIWITIYNCRVFIDISDAIIIHIQLTIFNWNGFYDNRRLN